MSDDDWPTPPEPRRRFLDGLLSAEIGAPSATVRRLLRRASGVYYVSSVGADKLRRALIAAEWTVAETRSANQGPSAPAHALGLPAPAGDLDTFAADLGGLRSPTALLWRRWEPLAIADPLRFAELLAVFRARVDADGPAFAVVLSGASQLIAPATGHPSGPDRHRGPTRTPLTDGPRPGAEPGRADARRRPGVRWTPDPPAETDAGHILPG